MSAVNFPALVNRTRSESLVSAHSVEKLGFFLVEFSGKTELQKTS
jgi:hypothetical protein